MTEDNNNQAILLSRQMVTLCQQLLVLGSLDLALEAAQNGKDCRLLKKALIQLCIGSGW